MQAPGRRSFLRAAGALALAAAFPPLRAAVDLPIADAHSHIGLRNTGGYPGSLKQDMQAAGVTLLAWTLSGDSRWTVRTDRGIVQRSAPRRGDQSRYVGRKLADMRRYLDGDGLPHIARPADIDAARSGKAHVVIAIEGAGFAEDGLEFIDRYHALGLRHLQLVHYVRNGLGDFQTQPPEHGGMTPLGVEVVRACNRLGILVDLAHATQPVIDRALEASTAPPVWSHSDIAPGRGRGDARSRLLHLDYARKIARRGGAIGLWSLRTSRAGDLSGYADGLLRMMDAVGAEHVMFGTDLDGVGRNGLMSGLADLRAVVELLRRRGVDEGALEAVCFGNYARCLRAAMAGASVA